jgi:hypothetical protein
MKRILLFSVVLCSLFLLLLSSCENPTPSNSISSSQIKYSFYKQEIAKLEYAYLSDSTALTFFVGKLFDLNTMIIDDLDFWHIPGPGKKDPCCDDEDGEEKCGGEVCAGMAEGVVYILFPSQNRVDIKIYDLAGTTIGETPEEKKPTQRKGQFVLPIEWTVDTLPLDFNIELKEGDQTYLVRYKKTRE